MKQTVEIALDEERREELKVLRNNVELLYEAVKRMRKAKITAISATHNIRRGCEELMTIIGDIYQGVGAIDLFNVWENTKGKTQ